MARGELRVYLGAAPGVGKTFAMLDEGQRRRARGTDVVVGVVETHGRPRTAERLGDLEVVPRRHLEHRGAAFEEMDLDAVLARRPEVVLVDELAHTNAPGSRHTKRWQDVEALLDAGITVISTVNIQHLESVNDVVRAITGAEQRETVPDRVVRQAEQVELVDMTPEALRRRMAHGNVYPAEQVDAALANHFRPGNLAALRELALLWVADRVDASLQAYLDRHGIEATWETRERIVVALTGAPGGTELVRRAARIAARVRADLIAVHVSPATGLRDQSPPADGALDRHRTLVRDVGGRYHETVDDDPARALVTFARRERATQLVLGATARTRWQQLVHGDIVNSVLARAEGIDVHVIAAGAAPCPASLRLRRHRRRDAPFTPRRRALGLLVGALALPLVTLALLWLRDDIQLSTVLLAFLTVTVVVTAIGGSVPGVAVAIIGFLLENWFFVEPTGTFTVAEPENLVSLLGFLAFAFASGQAVHRIATRSAEAARGRAEAAALARAAGTLAADTETLPLLVDNLRTTFELDAVSLLTREGSAWVALAASGRPAPAGPEDGEPFTVDDDTVLVLRGPALDTDVRVLVDAFARQAAAVLESARLRRDAAEHDVIARGDALRTGLLRSVSHDLRTPLAGIKASVTSLLGDEVTWTPEQAREFLLAIDEGCDRLNRLVTNLLDAGRLQSGAVTPHLAAVPVDELLASALASLAADDVGLDLDLPDDVPLLHTDPVLLERVLANLVANALRYSPPGRRVRVACGLVGDRVELLVVDRGPGIPLAQRAAAVHPFQRLGDGDHELGVGLGLAVANGFTTLLGGELRLDDTPGGGLTVTVSLPRRCPAATTAPIRAGAPAPDPTER